MADPRNQVGFTLRPACATDAARIKEITFQVQNNPLGLNWQRFVVAIEPAGQIIGCGQVKPHRDDLLELASLAVLEEWRDKGVAREIIESLLEKHPGRLYLTCRAQLVPLYQKFGFRTLNYAEMPRYYQRINRIVATYNWLAGRPNQLRVMQRN